MHLKTAHIPQGKHAALSEAVEGIHVATVLQGKSADIGVGQKAQQESLRFYFIILWAAVYRGTAAVDIKIAGARGEGLVDFIDWP